MSDKIGSFNVRNLSLYLSKNRKLSKKAEIMTKNIQ